MQGAARAEHVVPSALHAVMAPPSPLESGRSDGLGASVDRRHRPGAPGVVSAQPTPRRRGAPRRTSRRAEGGAPRDSVEHATGREHRVGVAGDVGCARSAPGAPAAQSGGLLVGPRVLTSALLDAGRGGQSVWHQGNLDLRRLALQQGQNEGGGRDQGSHDGPALARRRREGDLRKSQSWEEVAVIQDRGRPTWMVHCRSGETLYS